MSLDSAIAPAVEACEVSDINRVLVGLRLVLFESCNFGIRCREMVPFVPDVKFRGIKGHGGQQTRSKILPLACPGTRELNASTGSILLGPLTAQ